MKILTKVKYLEGKIEKSIIDMTILTEALRIKDAIIESQASEITELRKLVAEIKSISPIKKTSQNSQVVYFNTYQFLPFYGLSAFFKNVCSVDTFPYGLPNTLVCSDYLAAQLSTVKKRVANLPSTPIKKPKLLDFKIKTNVSGQFKSSIKNLLSSIPLLILLSKTDKRSLTLFDVLSI